MRRIKSIAAAGAAAAAALLLVAPTPASAGPTRAPTPIVRSNQLAAPFNLALDRGDVFVADGGLNLVGQLRSNGSIRTIAADQPGASGITVSGDGRYLAFTTTVTDPATFENSASGLNIWGPRGSRRAVDTLAYEKANNPDKINFYGVRNPSQCVTDALSAVGFPVAYNGALDSHAYSVTSWGRNFVVADAGANDLLSIDRNGRIRTIAVLPPQPHTVTAAEAAGLGLPACVAGVTYNFEPVPTDVEVGRDGYLYVTTLPGGPEGPALGARGKLWKVNPYSGKAWVIASGFAGATNLAIGKHGEFYVAELFGGQISKVDRNRRVSSYLALPGVVAVETTRSGQLWAGTLGSEDPSTPAPGTIVQIVNGHAKKVATIKP
jgi:hypothetical protein